MAYEWLEEKNPLIIYIADPMCSWCYGFAPAIAQAKVDFPNHEFRLVMGGLRPGGTDTMASMAEFLDEHWKEMEKRTGQPVNYGIIGDENFILDTEPGTRAVVTARSMNIDNELSFFHEVQKAFYVENKSMTATETFAELAEKAGLDRAEFIEKFESEDMKYATRSDFQLSSEMGVQGFPSVVIRHNGELFLAANGYRTPEDLKAVLTKISES